MAIKMKKRDLAIAGAIIALILGGVLAGLAACSMPDGINLSTPPETGVGVGGPVPPPLERLVPTWKLGNNFNAGFAHDGIKGLAWGKNTFVAVGTNAKGAKSADGITWEPIGSGGLPPVGNYFSVTWEGGTFVAGTQSGEAAWSPDGETWTASGSTGFGGQPIHGIAGGAGRFIAVGGNGKMAESGDKGATWTPITSGFGTDSGRNDISGIAYGDGYFVAVGVYGKIAWMDATAGGPSNFTLATDNGGIGISTLADIAFGNGVFVATAGGSSSGLGDPAVVIRSTDHGQTWTKVEGALAAFPNLAYVSCNSIAYGGGRFTMTGYTSVGDVVKILTSKDGGLTWTVTDSSCFGAEFLGKIAYGGGKFVTVTYVLKDPLLGYWAP